jgi:hypothetical protein
MMETRTPEEQDRLNRIMAELIQFVRNEPENNREALVGWIIKEIGFINGMDVKVMPSLDIDKLNAHLRFALWVFQYLIDDPAYKDKAFELMLEFLSDLLRSMGKPR